MVIFERLAENQAYISTYLYGFIHRSK